MAKLWDWRLFFAVLVYMFVPALYKSYGVALLGFSPEAMQNLAITSQWQFMQVTLEVFQEALVLPIFYFVGSTFGQGPKTAERVKTSLVLLIVMQGSITVVASVGVGYFVDMAGTPPAIVEATESYLRLMVWSSFFAAVTFGTGVVLQTLNSGWALWVLLAVKMIISVALDSVFIGAFSFSLQMGAYGASVSNLLSEAAVATLGLVLILKSLRLSISAFGNLPLISGGRLFGQLSAWIALDSIVRNVAYFAVILQLINQLGESASAGYFLVMHVFWSFLLVPFLALTHTARAIGSNHSQDVSALRSITRIAVCIATPFCLVFIAAGIWPSPFVSVFTDDPEVSQTAIASMKMLALPYALLGLNMVLDSVFYAVGKTKYLAFQSILTNTLVYGAAFILLGHIWVPSLDSALTVFGLGIIVDTAFTLLFLFRVLKTPE